MPLLATFNDLFRVLTQSLDGSYSVSTVVAEGAILAAIWNATPPDPELYGLGQIGADTNGVSTSLVYHVVGAVGAKAWVATGATVSNLYGA